MLKMRVEAAASRLQLPQEQGQLSMRVPSSRNSMMSWQIASNMQACEIASLKEWIEREAQPRTHSLALKSVAHKLL